MYRKTLFFTALLSVTFAFTAMGQGSSTWIPFSDDHARGSSPIVRLSQSYMYGFVVEMEMPGVYFYERLANHEKFVSINIPPFDSTTPQIAISHTSEVGKARLPIFRAFIAIPDHAEVFSSLRGRTPPHSPLRSSLFQRLDSATRGVIQPEIDDSSYCVLDDVYVYPAGRPVEREGGIYEEFAIDSEFYSSDVIYPPPLARVFGSFYLRDTRLACLEICPFQYNPARRQLVCYWKIRLRIQLDRAQVQSGVLSDIYSEAILNYSHTNRRAPSMKDARREGTVRYPADLSKSCRADYLIITPDVFYDRQKVSDLASWRAKYNGFDVAVVNRSGIRRQFGGVDTGIRDFIRHVYDSWTAPNSSDGHVAYVLLIGDVEYIPTHISNNGFRPDKDRNIATDNWYACISGEDYIPDVMLGRLPAKNIHELDVMVDKIIQYEKNPSRGEWVKRVLLVMGTIDRELDDLEYTKNEILLPAGYVVTELSKFAGDNAKDVIYQINEGHIIVDYVGHGFTDGWEVFRTHNIPSLHNKRMLPVVFSMACSTTAFDDENDCFAETMIKAPNGGCIAFFGASRIAPVSDVAFSLSRGMVQNHLFILGEIVMNTKLLGTLSDIDIELYNLLGDPALSLYAPRRDYYEKPDLAISPADIIFAPEEALPHSQVEIKAMVHNIGDTGAENVIVKFFRDGDTQQFIAERGIDHIPQKGEREVSVLWRVPGGKAQNKILVQVSPVDGEEYSHDNYATRTLWVSIEAESFPIAVDSAISSQTSKASAPVLYDLDGDGDMELILLGELSASSSYYVCAWRHDGTLVGSFPVPVLAVDRYRTEEVEISPAVGDMDSDGFAEMVCTFRTKKVYLLHHDGRIARGFPVQLRAFAASSPVLYDVNGDGRLEIILALTNGEVDVLKGDGTPLDGFPVFIHSGSKSAFAPPAVAVGDVDGDGKPEIVVKFLRPQALKKLGQNDSNLPNSRDDSMTEYILLNHDGSLTESSPIEIPGVNLFPPSLGDIDNDYHAEIVLVSEKKNIRVLNHNGTLMAGFPTTTEHEITSPPVLGDVDGDGLPEIVATALHHIYVWHHDGTRLTGFPVYVRGENSHPILADIDGDDRSEIIFVNNGIHAYHHDGTPVDGFPIKKLGSYRLSAPALADVDADGYLEMALTTRGDEIHLLEDVGIYNPGCIEWRANLHDAMNTNSYGATIALPMPEIYLESRQQYGGIVLSWLKASDMTDVIFYRILRAQPPIGSFSTLATVGKDRSTYVDDTATVDLTYWYKVVAENVTRTPIVSNIVRARLTSSELMLRDVCNYPNPAPSSKHPDSTTFSYYVAEDMKVRIRIYSITGQLVDEINHDARGGVHNEVEWNISSIASGLYFYVVEAARESGQRVNRKGKLAVIR